METNHSRQFHSSTSRNRLNTQSHNHSRNHCALEDDDDPLIDTIVNKRYRIEKYIGHGSFGRVYKGEDLQRNKYIAIKCEPRYVKRPQLEYESRVYNILKDGTGISRIYWHGTHGKNDVIVMQLLGKNLEKLKSICGHKFSLSTVLMLADQMLRRLEYVHSKGFVYRDIKPDNFVIGKNNNTRRIFLIDFGLSKRILIPETKKHIPFVDNKNLIGTARYASINAHLGYELSRRDDLESLGYVLLYFLKESLPWQGITGANKKEKYANIGVKKIQTPLIELCFGVPLEFYYYIIYCRNLDFEEKPNYSYLRKLFRDLFFRMKYSYDSLFDWEKIKEKKRGESRNDSTMMKVESIVEKINNNKIEETSD